MPYIPHCRAVSHGGHRRDLVIVGVVQLGPAVLLGVGDVLAQHLLRQHVRVRMRWWLLLRARQLKRTVALLVNAQRLLPPGQPNAGDNSGSAPQPGLRHWRLQQHLKRMYDQPCDPRSYLRPSTRDLAALDRQRVRLVHVCTVQEGWTTRGALLA